MGTEEKMTQQSQRARDEGHSGRGEMGYGAPDHVSLPLPPLACTCSHISANS